MRRYWPAILLFVVSLIFGLAPAISVAIAGTIASMHGCELHEGFVNPCVVGGVDVGETLYAMGVMGWFALITLPLGAVGVAAALIFAVVLFVTGWRGKERRKEG